MDKDRVVGSTKDFGGKVESTAGDVAGDVNAQADGLARQAQGLARNLYGQAKDVARDATEGATRYAKKAYENSGDVVQDGSKARAQRVQENPLGSLAVAGALGFALALMLMRPPSRPPRRWRYYG